MKGPTGLPGPTRFSQRSPAAAPEAPAPAPPTESDAPATLPIPRRDRVQALFDEEVTTLRDDGKTVVRRPDETTRPSARRPATPAEPAEIVDAVESAELQEPAEEEASEPPGPPPRDLFSDLLGGGDEEPPPEPPPESPPVAPSAEPTSPRYPLPAEPSASVVVSEGVFSEAPAPSLPPLVAAPVQAPAPAPTEHDEREDEPRARPLTFPFPLRRLIQSLKSGVGQRYVEEVSLALSDCVRTQHAQGSVLGERLIPENFTCTADRRVEFTETGEVQVRESVEVYLAPELIRAKAPTMQSDVFACAAVVYELLTGRTLKPMFMPKVLQTSRTDTWFVDPGASMHEQYKVILRKALADRPSERHTDAGAFSEDLVRAWRLIHNPPVRRVEVEKPRDDWSAIVKAIAVAALFILVLVGLLAFPTERHDAPPVRPVQPEITP